MMANESGVNPIKETKFKKAYIWLIFLILRYYFRSDDIDMWVNDSFIGLGHENSRSKL
jgi:hypothetical protein